MFFSYRQQQSDQRIVDLNRALMAPPPWLFQSAGRALPRHRSLGFLKRTFNPKRLCYRIKIGPLQGQNFVAPRAREGRYSNDWIKGGITEALHKARELLFVQHLTVIAFAG